MTRATIQVQVPQPCAEAWEAMTPTAQGRYCAACQHTVTDFTQRTDAEILALLRQAAGGRVCGRFRAGQLNRELVHAPAAAPRWRAWLLAAAALWGVPAAASAQAVRSTHSGGPLPAAGSRAATQQLVAPATDKGHTKPDTTSIIVGEPAVELQMRRITGLVMDQRAAIGLLGAIVTIEGSDNRCYTDADGRFELYTAEAQPTLVLSAIGYETKTMRLAAAPDALPVDLCVDMSETINGMIHTAPVWYSPRGWWYQLRSLPRRLTGRW